MARLLVLVVFLGACTAEGTQDRFSGPDTALEGGTLGRSSGHVPDAGLPLDTLPAQVALDSSAAPFLDGAPVVTPDALIALDTLRDAIPVTGDVRFGDTLLGDAGSTPTTCAEVNAWCGRCTWNCGEYKVFDGLSLGGITTPQMVEIRQVSNAQCVSWYRAAFALRACY